MFLSKGDFMRKKRKLKKSIKFLISIVLLLIIIKYSYSFLNSFELTENGLIRKQESNIIDNPYDIVSAKNKNNGTIKSRLKKMSKTDSRINDILNNYNDYPEELLDMLSRNIEMLDFVINYKKNIDDYYDGKLENIKKDEYPLLLQWDDRWGYAKYGDSIIAISGCAPTSLAMVIVGLTGNNTITPYTVAKFAEKNGYYESGTGTSWSLMTNGCNSFGLKSEVVTLSKSAVINSLKNGNPIICSVGYGDFTTQGHFIVLTGIENDMIKINDPNSKERSSILWTYERLEHQIKNMWVFSLK